MKKIFFIVLAIFLATVLTAEAADDLNAIYKLALANDPTFQQATAQLAATRENLPISIANLLPTIAATGGLAKSTSIIDNEVLGMENTRVNGSLATYNISISEPIFNYSYWKKVSTASATVKQAEAQYFSAAQNLIARTANAYFAVLNAKDVLSYTQSEKQSIYRQLRDAKQRYSVGLIAITSVYEAQAKYDKVASDEITAINNLQVQQENLRRITGKSTGDLVPLGKLLLKKPDPENIEEWMQVATQQNYDLLAARFSSLAAKENIQVQVGGHLPTVNAGGIYSYAYSDSNNGTDYMVRQKAATLNLNVTLPIYQGGLISAQVRQANDQYQQAEATQEYTYRQVISNARQSYLGIIDDINKIFADKQAIVSNTSNYTAMQASYKYGTRTMTDVLDAETTLYNSQKQYAFDQYDYIIQYINLKQAAGTLNFRDLQLINTWLEAGVEPTEVQVKEIGSNKSAIANPKKVFKTSLLQSNQDGNTKIKTVKTKANAAPAVNNKMQIMPSKSVRYLLALDPDHYVMQVMACSNESSARAFVQRYADGSSLHPTYAAFDQNGRKIYKVFVGDYTSLAAANAAKTKLANTLDISSLWPRKVATLQADLQEK